MSLFGPRNIQNGGKPRLEKDEAIRFKDYSGVFFGPFAVPKLSLSLTHIEKVNDEPLA